MPDTGARRFTAFLVPHTHWDREWYQPFQVFRARLVDVIDRVLDILDRDPGYRRFLLDGQAVVIEDYLEVRPERRNALRRHVQSGRLRIGPWYVLADEFLVSPESLIRNLMLGRRICEEFGSPLPVGYTPDSFGHVSQLPLIVRGFGLDNIVFERGVGDEGERLRGEFAWVAADGETAVLAAHLLGTYSPAAAIGHADWDYADPYSRERAVRQMRAVLYGTGDDLSELPEWLRDAIRRVPGGITAYATNGALILLNGSDHLFPQENVPQVIEDLNAAIPEVEFVHGDVEEFVARVRQPLDRLERHQGEFRGSRYQHVLSGVLSARLYLKQANHRAETLLERYAEPLAALAWLEGHGHPGHLIWQAWRLLLQNHPHDSICGCSVDAVHREMMTRFEGVEQLGNRIADQALRALAGREANPSAAFNLNAAFALPHAVAFNPLPWAADSVVEQVLEVPEGAGSRLRVLDGAGRPVPSQLRVETVAAAGRSDRRLDRVHLRYLATLPALGIASHALAFADAPAPTASVAADAGRIENGRLRVDVAADGRIDLTDKTTGQRYPLDLHFEDAADAGDEYDFSDVAGDAPLRLSEPVAPPTLIEAGPVAAALAIDYRFVLPARLSEDRRRREGRVEMPVRLVLSLDEGAPFVRLRISLDNPAEDHRLRLRVATGCQVDHVWADGHFDVLRRPVRPPAGDGWFQTPQPTNHERLFVAASDGRRGLAVLNRGLPEYEAIPTDRGVDLAVTLLRAVGWLSREDLRTRPQGAGPSLPSPEAQCLGRHDYDLALLPFGGPWWESQLVPAAQAFAAPARGHLAREAAPARTLVEITPPLVLSALKRAEDREALILRLWNPAPVEVSGVIRLARSPRAAFAASLGEAREAPLALDGRDLALRLGAKQVRTIELEFD